MNKKAFFSLCVAIFVAMLGMGIVSPLMAIYATSMGATGLMLGIMFSGFALSRALMQPITGWLSDNKGRKTILIIGLSLYTVISLGYAMTSNMYQLTVVRLCHGFASAMVTPVAQAYVGDLCPKGKEGTWMSLFSFSLYLGMAAGPAMGGWLADLYSMNIAFYVMAVFAAAGLILLILFVPQTEPQAKKGVKGAKPVMLTMLKDNKVKAVATYLGTRGIMRQSVRSFLALFAVQVMGMSTAMSGMMVSVYVISEAVSQVFVGPIADKFNRKVLMIVGALIAPVFALFISSMRSPLAMFALLVPMATMMAVGRVPALAYNVEAGRRFGRMGSTMGVTQAAQDMGHFFGPMVSGWAMDNWGIGAVFTAGAIMATMGVPFMIYWLLKKEPEMVTEASQAEPVQTQR